jgi:hypothetical protein
LALAGHDLDRNHSGLATRDRVDVDVHPKPCPRRRFARRARDSRSPEILNADDEVTIKQFETRFNQTLLFVWIANLHTRALRLPAVGFGRESRRCKDGNTAYAVPSGARAQ